MPHVYIAGAHSRAQTLKEYITYLYPQTDIIAFLVDDMQDNKEYVENIPVKLIDTGLDTSCQVYIATRGVNHAKLETELRQAGFTNIIPVTVQLDIELRNAYVKKRFESQGRKYELINDLTVADENNCTKQLKYNDISATIYVANSIFDKELQSVYTIPPYEKIIQVGAALTDKRVSEHVLVDCEGDNISDRNQQYCELTGIYWLWKHANDDYIGLAHYRRHFELPDDWISKLISNDVDVVLPVPLYIGPNIAENYRERHIAEDWDYLMEYFKNNLPYEYDNAKKIFAGNLFNPCNMFIMKKNVLNDMCTWLFPILDAVWKHGGVKDDKYMNRYPGFISERLITYFFKSRKESYRVVYANKNFLK